MPGRNDGGMGNSGDGEGIGVVGTFIGFFFLPALRAELVFEASITEEFFASFAGIAASPTHPFLAGFAILQAAAASALVASAAKAHALIAVIMITAIAITRVIIGGDVPAIRTGDPSPILHRDIRRVGVVLGQDRANEHEKVA